MRQNLDECIAVIGLAGKVPGACNAEQFWLNLAEGHEAVRFPGEDELLAAGVPARFLADPDYIKAVAEAPDLELFDAEFFGFTPRDAALLDPQIRMFLEVAHAAVENGGYDPSRIAETTGVFGATGANRYLDLHVRAAGQYAPSSTGGLALSTLSYPDYVATHAAYRFGFRGPALTVSTACSSSAVATHLACQALRTGECDFAIAGGTEAEIPAHHGYQWDPGGPMSQDGHCRPFDRQASGTIFSTGAGAVLLKRLGDAIADGDHIWAVIRASAVNNDGAAKAGFSAPGVPGQAAVIQEAMALAEVDATNVSYVEAHATGTLLGDPIEVTALARAFHATGADGRTEPVVLSSVKGNVGHLGHAAGVTSLIKLSLCLQHQRMAGTVNFSEANPRLALPETPFEVRDGATPWPREPNRPRIAGMSSLGIGGTNVHLIVEEGPEPARTDAEDRPRVVLWSAQKKQAVGEYQAKLAVHLRWHGEPAFADTAGTLQDGRTEYPVRAALVAASAAEAVAALNTDRIEHVDRLGAPRPVAFLFPGQAAQQPGMAAGLYGVDRAFTVALDTCFDLFGEHGLKLREYWPDAAEADITDTAIAQPLLFSVEYALAAMWRSWGIEPSVVIGHSLGELTAATVAGTFELSDAVRLVAARGAAMAAMPTGFMLAVAAQPDRLVGLLPDQVCVAVVNERAQTVLSGPDELFDPTLAAMRVAGLTIRRLATSHAFHSPMMAPAADRFAAAFADVAMREPSMPVISSATGAEVGAELLDPAFWTGALTRPVRFDQALDRLLRTDHLLIEVGPGHTLSGIARRQGTTSLVVPTLPRAAGEDHRAALAAAATVWTEGHRVDWPAVRQYESVRRLPVPGYQYQRSRHWLELRPETEPAEPLQRQTVTELTGRPVAPPGETSPFGTLTWLEQPRPGTRVDTEGRLALVLLPAEAPGREATVAALQQAGFQLVLLTPGTEFAERDDGDFQVRQDDPGDLDRVLDTLATRGRSATLLVHALGLADWPAPDLTTVDEQLADSFHSLTTMAQRGLRRDGVTSLLVLAGRSVDITGAEPLDPVKAAMHGVIRSLAAELPELDCRLIDVSAPVTEHALAAEIATATGEPVVALRGPGRWVRVERPLAASTETASIRRGGVYLITGGLGGLGLAVARALAGTGQRPNLILLGRTGITDDRQRAAVVTLEKLGAKVRVEACDVSDRRAMRRIFDTARAFHGAVHGVLHLAGVPGGGLLLLRRRADADAVLRPKVAGTLVLAEILAAAPPLDFFVSFSSRAAIGGLVGSADYAAANCFLDARTRLLARSGVPALAVNWPSWHTVGMAAVDQDPLPAGSRTWETVLDTADYPVLDEHRVGAVPVLPGTGHLDLVVRGFREELATPAVSVRLTEVVFHRVLTAQQARRVRVEFRPDGADWRFVVRSRPAQGEAAWITHVTGAIGAAVAARPALAKDAVAALRARLAEPVSHDPVAGGTQLFTLGPRWDNVIGIGVDPADPTERLVDLALPAPYLAELALHPLHPTMLDSATAEARVSGVDAPHLPFCYGSLTLYEDLPARFTSHIRRHADAADGLIVADIDLYGPQGRLLAAITDFTMRRVADEGFLTDSESTPDSARASEHAEGIAPEQGARMLLSLLGGGVAQQISVLPHVEGRPVGLGPVAPVPTVTAMAPIDRAAAPVPNREPRPAPVRADTVRNQLSQLWTDVLGVTAIGDTDDFFDLGGNSLTAVELMSTMRDAFGVRMSIVAMFDHPTLGELADAVAVTLAEQESR